MKRDIILFAIGITIILALAFTGCAGTEQCTVHGPGFSVDFKGKQTEPKPTPEPKPVNPFKPPPLPTPATTQSK